MLVVTVAAAVPVVKVAAVDAPAYSLSELKLFRNMGKAPLKEIEEHMKGVIGI